MSDVGKEHSQVEDTSVNRQELLGNEIIKKQQINDSSVNNTKALPRGLEQTGKDGSGKNQGGKQDKAESKSDKEKKGIKKIELSADPYLGKHLDIDG